MSDCAYVRMYESVCFQEVIMSRPCICGVFTCGLRRSTPRVILILRCRVRYTTTTTRNTIEPHVLRNRLTPHRSRQPPPPSLHKRKAPAITWKTPKTAVGALTVATVVPFLVPNTPPASAFFRSLFASSLAS